MATTVNLSLKHIPLALLTVFIWGTNFIAVYLGLKEIPPFLLCAIRFALGALPWIFIFPKPKAPFKWILGYGLFNFAMQFGFLFSAIHLGMSPGLSSLVLQVQVFFSIGLAYVFFRDKFSSLKIVGSLISFIGIGIVATHIDGKTTFIGLLCNLLAAFSWAAGNMFTKKADSDSPLSLVVWGNLIALPFTLILSLTVEGPALMMDSLQKMSWTTVLAIAYIVYLSTHIGYGVWGFLLKSYTTSAVVPFTLLIPIVGFVSSAVWLGEELVFWKILASLFITGGLAFNLLETKILKLATYNRAEK